MVNNVVDAVLNLDHGECSGSHPLLLGIVSAYFAQVRIVAQVTI